jgi:hypothetical protein
MSELGKYRFFGSESIVAGRPVSRYGQQLELDPAEADALVTATPSALLLPEDLWEPIGITEEELAEFPSTQIHGAAPDSFVKKAKAVRKAFHEYRETLLAHPAAQPRDVRPAQRAEDPVPDPVNDPV